MSDFERIFGEGADIDQIIGEINDSYRQERREESSTEWFQTYAEASEWAKKNPGQRITRHPVSGYEQVIKTIPPTKIVSYVWSIDPDAEEIIDMGCPSNVWGYWKSMTDDNEPPEKISKYLRDVVSMNGVCRARPIDVPQPPLPIVIASLEKAGMGLTPLSKDYCMIERLPGTNNWGENLAALITEDGETTLWGNIDFDEVYDALTCKGR